MDIYVRYALTFQQAHTQRPSESNSVSRTSTKNKKMKIKGKTQMLKDCRYEKS